MIGELKTDRSKRIVKVPEEALSVLRQVRLIQARTGLELGNPPGKDAPVFAFPDGRPWSPQGLRPFGSVSLETPGLDIYGYMIFGIPQPLS